MISKMKIILNIIKLNILTIRLNLNIVVSLIVLNCMQMQAIVCKIQVVGKSCSIVTEAEL